TTRRSVLWHPEQLKVWCSKPRTATVFSGTTFVRISSASHAVQYITRTPLAERPPIVASIEHFQRHPEVTRCGDELRAYLLPANYCHHAAQETRSSDVLI